MGGASYEAQLYLWALIGDIQDENINEVSEIETSSASVPSNQNGGYNHKFQKYQKKLRLLLN